MIQRYFTEQTDVLQDISVCISIYVYNISKKRHFLYIHNLLIDILCTSCTCATVQIELLLMENLAILFAPW